MGLDRVLTVTMDNASNNDTGIDYLRRQLQKTNIVKGKYLHMRCAAHIRLSYCERWIERSGPVYEAS
jgi:hypothetical protein